MPIVHALLHPARSTRPIRASRTGSTHRPRAAGRALTELAGAPPPNPGDRFGEGLPTAVRAQENGP
jgi:hypothetical protein